MRILSNLRYRCATTKAFALVLRIVCPIVLLVGISAPAAGQTAQEVKFVEERWEMVINEPDPNSHSPQVTFFTSPNSEFEDTYFQLQMNYAADEKFSGGGFHVAAVRNGQMLDEERSQTQRALSTSHDHIRWTNLMAVIDGKLYFAVKDGHSDDWGNFGGPEYLVEMPTDLTDLSSYSPQQSLATIDIGFGGNRVNSVTLRSVTLHDANGNKHKIFVSQQP